jgi:hypothetical protein
MSHKISERQQQKGSRKNASLTLSHFWNVDENHQVSMQAMNNRLSVELFILQMP